MYKVIALIGKSGSGKSSILSEVTTRYPDRFNKIIGYTTRPIRENEVDGQDYHFCSQDDFDYMLSHNEIIVYSTFNNNWHYITSYKSLDENKINIGIFNPYEIAQLRNYPDIQMLIVYLAVDDKERVLRQLNREDEPNTREICRRFLSDELDFKPIFESFAYFPLRNNTREELEYNVLTIGTVLGNSI